MYYSVQYESDVDLPVYDRPQLSSSLPSKLQNVCLYLSRFTSEVPMPTIYKTHTGVYYKLYFRNLLV